MGSFYPGEYNIKNPSTGTIYPMKICGLVSCWLTVYWLRGYLMTEEIPTNRMLMIYLLKSDL